MGILLSPSSPFPVILEGSRDSVGVGGSCRELMKLAVLQKKSRSSQGPGKGPVKGPLTGAELGFGEALFPCWPCKVIPVLLYNMRSFTLIQGILNKFMETGFREKKLHEFQNFSAPK